MNDTPRFAIILSVASIAMSPLATSPLTAQTQKMGTWMLQDPGQSCAMLRVEQGITTGIFGATTTQKGSILMVTNPAITGLVAGQRYDVELELGEYSTLKVPGTGKTLKNMVGLLMNFPVEHIVGMGLTKPIIYRINGQEITRIDPVEAKDAMQWVKQCSIRKGGDIK